MEKRRLTAILLPQEEGGYHVFFPYHPGCITSGKTVEDAFRKAKEAIETHLEFLADQGDDLLVHFAYVPHIVVGEVEAELPDRVIQKVRQEEVEWGCIEHEGNAQQERSRAERLNT